MLSRDGRTGCKWARVPCSRTLLTRGDDASMRRVDHLRRQRAAPSRAAAFSPPSRQVLGPEGVDLLGLIDTRFYPGETVCVPLC